MKATFVSLCTEVEGLHHWPGAVGPDGYLRQPHRHLFLIALDVEVFHDDREIEINAATRWLREVVIRLGTATDDGPTDFGPQSCEMLASKVVDAVADRFGGQRTMTCVVKEDGIIGAGVRWTPDRDRSHVHYPAG
jgi:hypothetical protein